MGFRYDDLIGTLRAAYDDGADRREAAPKESWKLAERATFLGRLRAAGCVRLLEVGAGTGQDSAFFQDEGLAVVATDLSPVMVEHCRGKGIEAHVRDFLNLGFPPGSFDAVYALNCLLHVPNRELPAVLAALHAVLRPGGLFYLGVYGAADSGEGTHDWDDHRPRRFFSWRTDEQIQRFATGLFDLVDFHVIPMDGFDFQSLTLRRPGPAKAGSPISTVPTVR